MNYWVLDFLEWYFYHGCKQVRSTPCVHKSRGSRNLAQILNTKEGNMKKDDEPVVVEQSFDQPIDLLWRAVTEIDQMRSWFFENIPDFRPETGFKTSFNVQANDRDYFHLWEITEVTPNKKITYSWKYKSIEGDGTVIFELFKEGEQNLLRLTNLGLETFPGNIPEFTRESCEGGWKYFINGRLKAYLDSD